MFLLSSYRNANRTWKCILDCVAVQSVAPDFIIFYCMSSRTATQEYQNIPKYRLFVDILFPLLSDLPFTPSTCCRISLSMWRRLFLGKPDRPATCKLDFMGPFQPEIFIIWKTFCFCLVHRVNSTVVSLTHFSCSVWCKYSYSWSWFSSQNCRNNKNCLSCLRQERLNVGTGGSCSIYWGLAHPTQREYKWQIIAGWKECHFVLFSRISSLLFATLETWA